MNVLFLNKKYFFMGYLTYFLQSVNVYELSLLCLFVCKKDYTGISGRMQCGWVRAEPIQLSFLGSGADPGLYSHSRE